MDSEKELVLTVGQFLDSVNLVLAIDRAFVRGEVSEFKKTDKWVSFTLLNKPIDDVQGKEEKAILKCVMGAWDFRRIGFEVADGMEVKVGGVPRITKSYGSFGLWVSSIEPLGEGSLRRAYQILLRKLETEGLYARKRALPEYMSRVGVISSRDGVVIHDFLNNLKPLGIKIDFLNSRVEGASAVEQLIRALRWFNENRPGLDAIVIIRGGGSLESMQAFNNENLCREVFASKIPIIAGIGHDVDVPIACLVADVSVSTPTAAAELVNSSWDSLIYDLPRLREKIFLRYEAAITFARHRTQNFVTRMIGQIKSVFTNFEVLARRIFRDAAVMIDSSIRRKRDYIDRVEKIINIASPERSLRLGYSLTTDARGKVVRGVEHIKKGDIIKTLLAGGSMESIVQKINEKD